MSILNQICADKLTHIQVMKRRMSLADLQEQIKNQEKPRGFRKALMNRSDVPALIAEIKKASPSHGLIRADFDAATLAEIYESSGATCLSVLTDEPYFQGNDADLSAAKKATALPVLRKDFMLDPYQIAESRALGADCILMIMAALDDAQASDLRAAAIAFDMDCLVEIHDEAELERGLTLGADMIGVNSRNLKTLEVDAQTTIRLAPRIPDGVLKIAESGIKTNADICRFQALGYRGFLVGESLMRQPDLGQAVQSLLATEK